MLPIKLKLSDEFYKEEFRDGYLVSQQTKELWAVELDLLVKLDEVCKKHNIKYWLDSGTLLGAVRHKGFIPWDDDIDVVVMRDGYEKLLKVADEFGEPYFLQSAYTDKNYSRGHLQLRNSKTCMMLPSEARIVEFNQGVFLDIFVLDGVITDNNKLTAQFKTMNKYKKYMRFITYQRSLNLMKECIKKLRAAVTQCIFGSVENLFDKFSAVACQYSNSDFVDKLMFRNKPIQCKFLRKSDYDITLYVEFENMYFPIPAGYDSVLRNFYGDDYMTPIKTSSAHGEVIVDTKHSYVELLSNLHYK